MTKEEYIEYLKSLSLDNLLNVCLASIAESERLRRELDDLKEVIR